MLVQCCELADPVLLKLPQSLVLFPFSLMVRMREAKRGLVQW